MDDPNPKPHPPRSLAARLDTYAAKIYRPIGFTKGYNFILWFMTTSGLLGFVLARLAYLNYDGIFCAPLSAHTNKNLHAGPGQCYFGLRGHTRVGLLMHLATILPAGLLVCVQFVPVVRHRWLLVHRLNGYVVILLSLVSTAAVFMIARDAMGGDPDTQMYIGVLGAVFLIALGLAWWNVKRLQIELHRKWMLRAWVYATSIITLRPIGILGAPILSRTGPYYIARPCKIIHDTLGNNQGLVLQWYPSCHPWYDGADDELQVLVRADTGGNLMERAAATLVLFAAAGWLALTMHAIAVEVYLHLTPAEHERLRNVSYQRQVEAGMKNPGRAGLTADRLGDSALWTPQEATTVVQTVATDKESTTAHV
ncbi:uncharacterized protein B0I36DRAFT_395574 [Microdochium trichocladiopsis]|uniref:Microtubule associated protein n=1 Tax=Microdochium trichocladiopsis TaxID=1682393 RepID=A0A9P8XV03_9PEZI|nr:uncharacterized protein B0I36DRAFT_395574 [Microdochium trichocladiopsis]KAH7018622.1 hypothetical protein B0I36DRAFT_395574 [Microdochium trichocladiopsis]